MSLSVVSSRSNGVLHLTFNQDSTCIAIASTDGVRIFNIELHRICYKHLVGAVSLAEMLFCTSLIAYVGAGEQPSLTPRKLTVVNTTTNSVIQALSFPSSVLAVRMNRQRLVVVLDKRAVVHTLQTLVPLRTLDTAPNPSGICALTPCSEPNLLALPASNTKGTLRVYDLLVDGGNVLCEMSAHAAPLAALAWSSDGTLLASASTKGTVLRVHRLPSAAKAFTFRRGSTHATIHSMAFSPAGVQPPLLCAASSHGTVHVFRLEPPERHPAVAAASAAVGLLSAVVKHSMADMVEPARNILTVRLPRQGQCAVCALQLAPGGPVGAAAPYGTSPTNEAHIVGSSSGLPSDSVVLVAASADGLLYEYLIEELRSADGPKCSLEKQWNMLGSGGSSGGR